MTKFLKELLGDDYNDELTPEQISKAIEDKVVKKPQFDKSVSDLNQKAKDWKKKYEELQEKHLTAEQIAEKQQQEMEQMKSKLAKELSTLRAKEVFTEAGLSDKEYSSVLDFVVSEDEETTKQRAQNLISLLNAQKETAAKSKERELLDNTPKPPAGKGDVDNYEDKIKTAREAGNYAEVAAYTRLQQQAQQQNRR